VKEKARVQRSGKLRGLKKNKNVFFIRLRNTGANPINIITPTPNFWCWRNYDKSLKLFSLLKIMPKDIFWRKFWCKTLRSNLCKKIGIVYVKK
jgi:hypothetical protein